MITVATIVGLTIVAMSLLIWDTFRRALVSQDLRARLRIKEAHLDAITRLREELLPLIHNLDHATKDQKGVLESVIAGVDVRRIFRGG